MPALEAVVELSGERSRKAPWPLAVVRDRFVRLSGDIEAPDIGSVVEEIADYCRIDTVKDASSILAELAIREAIVVGGGLRVKDGDKEICPECCAGLERWRDWEGVPAGNYWPWMGHGQAVWVEPIASGYRVCANENDDYDADPTTKIEFTESEMIAGLELVQQDLLGFLAQLREWATALAPNQAEAFVEAIDRAFAISAPRS